VCSRGGENLWEPVVQAVWGPEYATSYVALPGATSYEVGGVNRGMVNTIQKYWTSFAISGGDPNALRDKGVPRWDISKGGRRLKLQTNSTIMENGRRYERERYVLWKSLSNRTHI